MSAADGTDRPCDAHSGTAAEFRAMAVAALDRLQPVLDRLRADGPTGPAASGPGTTEPAGADAATEPTAPPGTSATPVTCAVCPVCAVLAALRGERPELAVRLAEHASGLLAVLRAALDEGVGAPGGTEPGDPTPGGRRRVQHIPVTRG